MEIKSKYSPEGDILLLVEREHIHLSSISSVPCPRSLYFFFVKKSMGIFKQLSRSFDLWDTLLSLVKRISSGRSQAKETVRKCFLGLKSLFNCATIFWLWVVPNCFKNRDLYALAFWLKVPFLKRALFMEKGSIENFNVNSIRKVYISFI